MLIYYGFIKNSFFGRLKAIDMIRDDATYPTKTVGLAFAANIF